MLPVSSGDRVLIVGAAAHLGADLARDGAAVVHTARQAESRVHGGAGAVTLTVEGRLSGPSGTFDHVLLPQLTPELRRLRLAELSRVLRPGGTVYLGVPHRVRSRSPVATTVARGRRELAHAGFVDIEVFGLRHGLDRPRHVVPLDSPTVMAWFLGGVYQPRPGGEFTGVPLLGRRVRTRLPVLALGPGGNRSRFLLGQLARSSLPRLLFGGLGFVARREHEC